MKSRSVTLLAALLAAAGSLFLAGCYTQVGTADAEGNESYDGAYGGYTGDSTGSGETYEESRQRFYYSYDYYYPSAAFTFGIGAYWGPWGGAYYDPWYWYGSAWYPYGGYYGGYWGGYWGGYYPYPPYYGYPYPYPYAYRGGVRTFGSTRGGVSRGPSTYTRGSAGIATSPSRGVDRSSGSPRYLPGATVTPGRTGTQAAPPRTSRRDQRAPAYREQQRRSPVDGVPPPVYNGGQRRSGTNAPPPPSYDGGARHSGGGGQRSYSAPPPSSGGGNRGGAPSGGSSGGGSGRGGGRR